ncbi:MAG: LysM peptidoglycan-binding domain-containing protein [Verrucomicrobia bacterium]|nr:LysM peptidoglycan-binding domain-containing protein [Verrucomicrobiota bacterium]
MKLNHFIAVLLLAAAPVFAQENAALSVLEEKVNRLRAEVEDLQFRQRQTDKAMEAIRAEIKELHRNAGAVSADDLKALEAKIAAVDAARQKDNKIIVDELARQLATIGGSGKPAKAPVVGDAKEHVVQKGETLTSIAKQYGISVAALKKANTLAVDSLVVGQKLAIPPK